jgi:hypothetical protein
MLMIFIRKYTIYGLLITVQDLIVYQGYLKKNKEIKK